MKRLISLLLCAVLLLGLCAGTAFAADGQRQPVTEDQLYPHLEGWNTKKAGPQAFTYEETEYYVGAKLQNTPNPGTTIGMGGNVYNEQGNLAEYPYTFCVSFWTMDADGHYIEVNAETRQTLENAFENLTLTLYAEAMGQCYPLEVETSTDYACALTKSFDVTCNGGWLWVTTGVIAGQAIDAQVYFNVGYFTEENYEVDSLVEAQETLNRLTNKMGVTPCIILPAEELEGDLTVPASIDSVQIKGSVNEKGDRLTTLNGSIRTENYTLQILDLHMKGNGKNSAVTGSATAFFGNCVVEGYKVAVATEAFSLGSVATTFRDNKVAIQVNTDNAGGNPQVFRCIFENNGTALRFQKYPGVPSFDFVECQFLDNKVDIHNGLGKSIFVPYTYFKTGNVNVSQGNVYDYPVAKDSGFTGYFYEENDAPTVSNTIRYAIPASALDGKTITVLDHDVKLAEIAFDAPEAQLRQASFRLRRLSDVAEEETFSPKVALTQEGDTLTVNLQEIPTGKSASVTVPCPTNWRTVSVTAPDGTEAEPLSVENGTVCFQAEAGGDYVIEVTRKVVVVTPPSQDTQKEETPAPSVPVFADVQGSDHWAKESVEFVTSHGLFNGVSADRFDPDGTMTRAMLMTVLARLDGQDTEGGESWFEAGMDWAVKNGISDGTAPGGSITREQLVTMLWRYADEPKSEESLTAFADAGKVSGYAAEAVAWAVETGLLKGMDGKLVPQGTATRAQVATILMRYWNLGNL